eukprot:g295.t1
MAQDLQGFFDNIPPVTKFWLIASFLTTLSMQLRVVSIGSLFLDFDAIFSKFQIWRLFTAATFFGKFSFQFLFQLFFMITYGSLYEKDPFELGPAWAKSAHFAFMLLVNACVTLVVAYFMNLYFIGGILSFTVIYACSRRHPEANTGFMGFSFKVKLLPWVLMALGILMGGDPTEDLIGIAVGHLFYFVIAEVPQAYGYHLLQTPEFLINLIEGTDYTATPGGVAARAGTGRHHAWGGGQTLGSG